MTDRFISGLPLPAKAHGWPAGRGLTLWAHPSGAKIWRFRGRVQGRQESVTLGRWPGLGERAAQRLAEGLLQRAERGHSLTDEVRRRRRAGRERHPTVRAFAARWMREVVVKVRKDPRPVERLLEREILPQLGPARIGHVTAAAVRTLIFAKRDAGRPMAAAALRHAMKRLWDYAMVCGVAEMNPVAATPLKFVAQRRSRSRTLSADELRRFWPQSRRMGPKYGAVARLILLTLCRKSELLQARWRDVDWKGKTLDVPAERSKTGLPHIVYLSDAAVLELETLQRLAGKSECVVPMRDSLTEPANAAAVNKAILRVEWGMPRFTPHDLRRTGATLLNEQGYESDWIEKALNHSVRGVRGVYNRAQYAEQRRRMLQEWALWLLAL